MLKIKLEVELVLEEPHAPGDPETAAQMVARFERGLAAELGKVSDSLLDERLTEAMLKALIEYDVLKAEKEKEVVMKAAGGNKVGS